MVRRYRSPSLLMPFCGSLSPEFLRPGRNPRKQPTWRLFAVSFQKSASSLPVSSPLFVPKWLGLLHPTHSRTTSDRPDPNRSSPFVFEKFARECLHSVSLFHSRSPFLCALSTSNIGSVSHPAGDRPSHPICETALWEYGIWRQRKSRCTDLGPAQVSLRMSNRFQGPMSRRCV